MGRKKQVKPHMQPNFGHGKSVGFALRNLLTDVYADGHYSTVETHYCRFSKFVDFFRANGVRDVRYVTQGHADAYAASLKTEYEDGHLALSYVHALYSSVNVVMQHFRRDRKIRIKASEYVPPRKYVCEVAPEVNDPSLNEAVEIMDNSGLGRAGAIAKLCRHFGVRLREACLANLERWSEEARKTGYVRILDGTKGGRKSDLRQIKVLPEAEAALKMAMSVKPEGSKNLIAPDESYKKFKNKIISPLRKLLKDYGIVNVRILRTFYMIELFERETGMKAPVLDKGSLENEELLKRGYEAVARAAGHNRISIARAYVG